jgi:DNA-binding transcriptional MocR family regulator
VAGWLHISTMLWLCALPVPVIGFIALPHPVQAAVGRLPGNLSASDAEGIQATLTDVLEQQATHVQAHYRQAASERLARLRRRLAHDPAVLQQALAQHVPALEAASEAGARAEMTSFVEQVGIAALLAVDGC